ncbi:acyl-[acyl-carrier-protein] thioesterase [Rhodococcoides yunnanense]|uniref:acyl-[acyl-carrier-protein] thioesterase n=1 Tax=Rhodococcoides yunnanense TaxID=278209 RepID=UPI0009355999|nr:acyl-ACP thioesterase domain-containing protein [Rhodococcus yunnanensis]
MGFDDALASPPPEGEGFETNWTVRPGDVDPNNRLRFDGIARYLQDVGSDNLDATSLGETDPFWIVRRTVIDVVVPVEFPDRVHMRRWCSSMSTRWSNMRVSIGSGKGARIETEGFWINISATTGMPTRISDTALELLARTTDQHRLRWKAWLTEAVPAESHTDVRFPLRATDIDSFNHVNNAAYWHAVEEFVVDHPHLVARSHRAVIEYLSPVLANEHVTIRNRYENGALTLWFVVEGSVRTVAKIAPRA